MKFGIILSSFAKDNKYVKFHTENLTRRGVSVKWLKGLRGISFLRLIGLSSSSSLYHSHWPHNQYFSSPSVLKGIASTILSIRFIIFLLLMKYILNIKFIWEMHNFLPHEDHRRWLDRFVLRFILRLSDGIIGHCELVKDLVKRYETMYEKKVIVIPHPSFSGELRDRIERDNAREHLKLPDEIFVYLYFGKIRPYKGVDNLISAFRRIVDDNSTLIIAGRFEKEWYREEILELVSNDERIVIIPEWIDECERDYLFSGADCLVLPYRDILTSGVVLLGLEYGLPMVLPRVGCLPEQIGGMSVIFYENDDIITNLSGAMIEVRNVEFLRDEGEYGKMLRELSWGVLIDNFIRFYKSLG